VVVADAKGLRIFSLDTRQVCYQIGVGAVSAAEMLFSTSLLAFVGSGARQRAIAPHTEAASQGSRPPCGWNAQGRRSGLLLLHACCSTTC